jgi:hypothetical protein
MYRYLLPALAVVALGGCATHAMTSGRVVIQGENAAVDVAINQHDRTMIRDYYTKAGAKQKGLPPGLAKRNGGLPPGLAKRDTLPPGLQTAPLPYDLESRLTRLPDSYVRVRVARDIVLMDKHTRVVFDVMYGAAI